MSNNNITDNSTLNYTMGYDDAVRKLLSRRSVETDAAHLLGYLKPGLRVLDMGCGPGTISLGLAKAVEPGELYGIDMEESQINIAQAAASTAGYRNAIFQTSDATKLPFENSYFDIVHCNAVLFHIPDTNAALAEVRRVLKPGGIISSRDMFVESSFFEPEVGSIFDTFSELVKEKGGYPQMGKELKQKFLKAGFSDVISGISFEPFITTEDVNILYEFVVSWFFGPRTVQEILKHGILTKEELDELRIKLDEWKNTPGSLAGFAWGNAIGRN